MLALTPTDDAILKALGRYTYLRVDQLFRLLPGTPRARPLVASTQLPKRPDPHRYLQQRCKRLLDAGYLRRRYLPLASPPRKSPALLWLDRTGIAHVRSLGFPAIAAPKPSDVDAASYAHLAHTLLANDLPIAADAFCRARPDRVRIERFCTERELAQQSVPVELPNGTKSAVKLDGFVDLRIDRPDRVEQVCCGWELDNGSEYRAAWDEKLARLAAFALGPYRAWAGATSLAIAVVAAPGAKRADWLLGQTERYLRETRATHLAPLFRFAGLDPSRVPPERLFLAPVWFVPFRQGPVRLVGAGDAPGADAGVDVAALRPRTRAHFMPQEQLDRFMAAEPPPEDGQEPYLHEVD